MNERIVVYAGNRDVYEDMYTAAKSLLMHTTVDKVYFLIEDDAFPFDLPDIVETINVSNQTYFPEDGANYKTRFSYLCLLRACYAEIFPQHDRILSLDIDTIVTGDISAIWGVDLDGYYFAACQEPISRKGARHQKKPEYYIKQDEYYNVGVALYNLKKQREDGIAWANVSLLNEREFYSIEQDTMNLTCQGKILPMSPEYNSSGWTGKPKDAKIIHYAGIPLKEWRKEILPQVYKEMPMESVMAANRKLRSKGKDERVVVYAGTRNLYSDMVTAVKSLLNTTRIDRVYLLIEDDEMPGIPPEADMIEILNVRDQPYFPLDSPNAKTLLTYMVLLRGAYHRMFTEHDKVLSIDVDTIVARDISGLWDYDLSEYYYAAVIEPPCSKGGFKYKRDKYYNNGVIVMNLEKLRDGTGDAIINMINSGKTEAQEQGVFNELCDGHILPLPVAYNSGNDWTGHSVAPKIIHYAGDRHWQGNPELRAYREIKWSDIMEKQRRWQSI